MPDEDVGKPDERLDEELTLKQASAESKLPVSTLEWRTNHNKLESRINDRGLKVVTRRALQAQPPLSNKARKRGPYQKRDAAVAAATKEQKTNAKTDDLELHIAHIHGRVQRECEIYADSLGVPSSIITHRVGELLQRTSGRKVLGTNH